MNQLLDKALELPISERIRFVEDVWDSIAVETNAVELSDAQRAELDRRMKNYKADPSENVPWQKIKAEALARK